MDTEGSAEGATFVEVVAEAPVPPVESVAERVARGLAVLRTTEGFDPGRVDLDRLDMRSSSSCVLAQALDPALYDHGAAFYAAMDRAIGRPRGLADDLGGEDWATAHGFFRAELATWAEQQADWQALETEWRRALSSPIGE